ncbi:MAG: hypothetical protein R3335_05065 [Anaerolineales bacterium]|nr:hypothetical protein [Anaerolineales bacterium]
MAQTTLKTNTRPNLLHRALLANGMFSTISGLALILFSGLIGNFIGISPSAILAGVGAVLVLFGLVVLWVATRPAISRSLAAAVTILDLVWVAGSILLLITGVVPFTPEGKWAVAIAADIVAVFAVLQIIGLRRPQ